MYLFRLGQTLKEWNVMPRTLSTEVEINGLQPSKPCYIKLQAFNDYGASQTSIVPIAYNTQGYLILQI